MPVTAAYCCYLLRSLQSRHTYVGITNNLPRRSRQHNGELTGGAKYTQSRRPWRVVGFVSGFQSHQEALMFEWAWRRASRGSGGGVEGRRTVLRQVLNRERWTARSPLAADVPLTLHWLQLPDGDSGGELLLGPPLRAEVTEVIEPPNGVENWAAVRQPKHAKRPAHSDHSDSDEGVVEDDGGGEDEDRDVDAGRSNTDLVTPAAGMSHQHYASAWLDAEEEWAALEAGLDAPKERPVQTEQGHLVPSNQLVPSTAVAFDLTSGTTDSSDDDDSVACAPPRGALTRQGRKKRSTRVDDPGFTDGAVLASPVAGAAGRLEELEAGSNQRCEEEQISKRRRRRRLSKELRASEHGHCDRNPVASRDTGGSH